jgi:hypothetical protein
MKINYYDTPNERRKMGNFATNILSGVLSSSKTLWNSLGAGSLNKEIHASEQRDFIERLKVLELEDEKLSKCCGAILTTQGLCAGCFEHC